MFKPVTGHQLDEFDPETRELFKRRYNEPSFTAMLMALPRKSRDHLPFYVDKSNEIV